MIALAPALALPPPRLHRALKSRTGLDRSAASASLGFAPLALLLAALAVAGMAQHTAFKSLVAIAVLTAAAVTWGWSTGRLRRKSPALPLRPAKIRADRRPFLLRPVMILGPGRPNRIMRPILPRFDEQRFKPQAQPPAERWPAPRRQTRLISHRAMS